MLQCFIWLKNYSLDYKTEYLTWWYLQAEQNRTHFVGSFNNSKHRFHLPEINEFQDLALISFCMAWNLPLFIHSEIPYLEMNKYQLIALDLFRLWYLSTFKKNFWHHVNWNFNVTPITLKLLDFAKIPNDSFFLHIKWKH